MEEKNSTPCCALVLAGGSGTRFWPVSRRRRPKQLLSLMGQDSLLRDTVSRLAPLIASEHVFCCTTEALAEQVSDDLEGLAHQARVADTEGAVSSARSGWRERVLAEPMGRNTAPAIAWSVDVIDRSFQESDPIVVVLPSDHYVTEPDGFRQALAVAIEEARDSGRIVTLGVPPRWAETGYGYLELKNPVQGLGVYDVERFTEKPDLEHAEQFVAGGRHLWNGGIFVFRASVFARRMLEFQPEISDLVERLRGCEMEEAATLYGRMPSVSIDFGLMEHLEDIAAVPLECGWNDLGSWDALAAVLSVDDDGNRTRGETFSVDSSNNLLFADHGSIAVAGVENLVVVRTADSVLVVPQGSSQVVREVVAELRKRKREDLL